MSLVGGLKLLTIEVLRVMPKQDPFDGRWLLTRNASAHVRILSRALVRTSIMNFVTNHKIHIDLLGPVPIGAWIPFPGSKVSLGQTATTAFASDRSFQSLTERYPLDIGWPSYNDSTKAQSYPIGDFLGQRLVIWTDDRDVTVPGVALRPRKDGAITALVIRRWTFSTRIGAIPLGRHGFARLKQRMRRYPKRSDIPFFSGSDGGNIELVVDEPLSAAAYKRIRLKLRRNDITAVKIRWAGSAGIGSEGERYPPMPHNAGFNVFGPTPALTLYNARGSLRIGDQEQNIGAPADIELTDVHALQNGTSDQSIPLPLTTSRATAILQFTAVGQVRINGITQTTFAREHAEDINIVLLLASLTAAAFAVLLFLRDLGRETVKASHRSLS